VDCPKDSFGEDEGFAKWYNCNLEPEMIFEEPFEIIELDLFGGISLLSRGQMAI